MLTKEEDRDRAPVRLRLLSTRKVDDERKYIKATPFVTPCYTFPPAGADKGKGERSFHVRRASLPCMLSSALVCCP